MIVPCRTPEVRRQYDSVEREQWIVRRGRFLVKHVEARPQRNLPLLSTGVSASSSVTGPRDVLIKIAVGLSGASSDAPNT